jgi:CelD/BcsL family acetyltransferase involved in cellulose biosynthesis
VLADETVRAFHAEAAPMLQAAGLLRLHGMRLDGELIGVLYCLADPSNRPEPRWYDYIGGFDPRHAALAPGTLLIAHAIESAMAEGAVAFDFLRGAEPYKYHWGAVDQAMFTLRATCPRALRVSDPAPQSVHPA